MQRINELLDKAEKLENELIESHKKCEEAECALSKAREDVRKIVEWVGDYREYDDLIDVLNNRVTLRLDRARLTELENKNSMSRAALMTSVLNAHILLIERGRGND